MKAWCVVGLVLLLLQMRLLLILFFLLLQLRWCNAILSSRRMGSLLHGTPCRADCVAPSTHCPQTALAVVVGFPRGAADKLATAETCCVIRFHCDDVCVHCSRNPIPRSNL